MSDRRYADVWAEYMDLVRQAARMRAASTFGAVLDAHVKTRLDIARSRVIAASDDRRRALHARKRP